MPQSGPATKPAMPTTIDDDRALAVALISDMGLDDLPPEWWEKTTWRRGDMNAKLLEAASRLIFIASTEDGADEYDLDGVADRVSCLNEIRYRGC